jgi:predicted deacylase
MLTLSMLALLAQTPAPAAPALDFTEEARILYRVVACGNDAALPEGMDAKIVDEHCKELRRRADKYRETWIKEASPFIQGLNPPGLLQSTRQWTPYLSRSAPNLNRELPGKEGGSAIADFAGRLWSRLIRPNADSAVDLHTQSRGTAYMMYAFASTPRTRRMAELVAPDIIKMDKGDKGTVENTLTDDGVPAITLELGRPEMFDDTMIARAESGLTNLMREMKMLPGKVTPPPAVPWRPFPLTSAASAVSG